MKDYLIARVREASSPQLARSLVREYLQARILGGMQRAGALIPLAFQGGTALRFLYHLPRFSEDLDFALERARQSYDLRAYLRTVRSELIAEGYVVEIKLSDKRMVHSAFVGFVGLLRELSLSGHREEKLSVKLEVDTNPPGGAILATTVVRRHVTLQLQHHDRSSLFAGKLHAVLQRPYPKGRDLYDLLWYLSDPDQVRPNLILLNNALAQTGWSRAELTEANWRGIMLRRVVSLNWKAVEADARPFLERPEEVEMLTPENLARLLGGKLSLRKVGASSA